VYIKLVLFVFKFYIMNNKKKALQLQFVLPIPKSKNMLTVKSEIMYMHVD